MKWLSKWLNKTPEKRPVSPKLATIQAAMPGEDVEQLRGVLANARDGDRIQIAGRLGRALAGRSQAPLADDPSEVWVAAVCHAPDKALALTWVANLQGDDWLGEVVSQARISEVRFAAAQRIEASAALEQVALATRDKDKRVYRHCSDLLRHRRQVEASIQRVREISNDLNHMLATAPLSATPLLDLKKELGNLAEAGDTYLACNTLMQRALAQLQQESVARQDLQLSQAAAATLAAECASPVWPWTAQIEDWRARLTKLTQVRDGLPLWLADQVAARSLSVSVGEIEHSLTVLAADDERVLACEQFLCALEAEMQPTPESSAAWDALLKPGHPDARQPLETRWQLLSAHLPEAVASEPEPIPVAAPIPEPRRKRQIDQDAVGKLLDRLEQAVAEGHLIDADTAAKQIKSALGGLSLSGALESRLHSLQAQVETLRGWARWGNGQARDQLIAAAEALLNSEHDVDKLAKAIPALREDWKRLNAHGATAGKQWQSFDTALEKAYQPVAARRAEEAIQQAETRTVKDALCAAWETETLGVDWEHANFKAIEARRAEMLKQWHATPKAGFRDERALRKRLDSLIAGIDQRLAAARSAESERREQLIAAAEALIEQTDLRQAMSEAKTLQSHWSGQAISVRLKRSEEEKLWRRFRTACNAVFERQEALRADQTALHQEWVQSRQKMLDDFAMVLTAANIGEVKRVLVQFQADWGRSRPTLRESVDQLESRARELQQQAQQRLAEARNEKHRAGYDLLARKAALAEQVESAVVANGPHAAVVTEAKQIWDGLPPLPGNTEIMLAKRFAMAVNASPAELAAGHEARETMLLDLEIALGLPSPKQYAESRHERQLERLQNRFGATSAMQLDPDKLLVQWYATAALPDADSSQRLTLIVQRLLLQSLEKDSSIA